MDYKYYVAQVSIQNGRTGTYVTATVDDQGQVPRLWQVRMSVRDERSHP